jgi:hypothetical protein
MVKTSERNAAYHYYPYYSELDNNRFEGIISFTIQSVVNYECKFQYIKNFITSRIFDTVYKIALCPPITEERKVSRNNTTSSSRFRMVICCKSADTFSEYSHYDGPRLLIRWHGLGGGSARIAALMQWGTLHSLNNPHVQPSADQKSDQ